MAGEKCLCKLLKAGFLSCGSANVGRTSGRVEASSTVVRVGRKSVELLKSVEEDFARVWPGARVL